MWAQGQTFGTNVQPFGRAVSDPQSDLRLASFAMNTIDVETGMVFDVWMTNTKVYPYYERLDLVTVAYDRSAGVVRWIINGSVAATVDKIGFPSSEATLIIDRGGTPQLAAPRQINGGMALFTLMDGGLPPTGEGLVRLGGSYEYPRSFIGGSTLFGQGAEMQVRRLEVRTSETGP